MLAAGSCPSVGRPEKTSGGCRYLNDAAAGLHGRSRIQYRLGVLLWKLKRNAEAESA